MMVFLGSWRCQAQTSPTQLLYLALLVPKALFESDVVYDEKRRRPRVGSISTGLILTKTTYCPHPAEENMLSGMSIELP
jgi:hypothetical protein